MLNHEDSLYAMRDVESASGLKTELIEMRDSIDARMFTYHDIRFGSRARETKAVASELALPGYVEREAQFYDAAKAVLEEIDDALQSDDVCAPRDHIRAIRASLVEVRRRAIHLLKRVRNFEARSA
ncbi:hypothetical protein [Caballeronia zhejiangensis]|uniref:Uncharacterized protein n=1 Tax=Caballeronia zhejiangensis TaxID=871203 RepID=A0A656QQV5_9BURK|nr:hypothetical protein [Caballeronia zhejiangensis]KDR31774.1 hypothetical protein BG60_29090 [Caballeronia zhejiangensis]